MSNTEFGVNGSMGGIQREGNENRELQEFSWYV